MYGKLFKLCCYELKRIEMCNYVFNIVFLFEGRVQCHREVYIPEADRSIVFYVCCREKGIRQIWWYSIKFHSTPFNLIRLIHLGVLREITVHPWISKVYEVFFYWDTDLHFLHRWLLRGGGCIRPWRKLLYHNYHKSHCMLPISQVPALITCFISHIFQMWTCPF